MDLVEESPTRMSSGKPTFRRAVSSWTKTRRNHHIGMDNMTRIHFLPLDGPHASGAVNHLETIVSFFQKLFGSLASRLNRLRLRPVLRRVTAVHNI
jgi:hypothetical protein